MNTMQVYVSSYRLYNSGSLRGGWVDLTQFSSEDELIDYIYDTKELGLNRLLDEELMFQDWEGVPDALQDECCLDPRLFEYINISSEWERDVWEAAMSDDSSISLEDALDKFETVTDSKRKFAEEWHVEELDQIKMADYLRNITINNMDYDALAHELKLTDYDFVDFNSKVYVFRKQ